LKLKDDINGANSSGSDCNILKGKTEERGGSKNVWDIFPKAGSLLIDVGLDHGDEMEVVGGEENPTIFTGMH